ncbi:MAG: aspartate carbamoyltransferase regulatory subunit [Treponema sp.]|nr:aspartate carbamoyltransferase regulatory subunit [Spirochaetia bacterium]MDD7015146.1 aspartate carbamoyltransferase regulatory subunit [Spirochaetales bacterium]MDY4901368.1 aspartate carbamoyltransferase regulatory subunit [Treponema sp.]
MLNIEEIKNGLVIDHIQAGLGWKVFKWLGLDKANFTTALVVNAQSQKSGKKDIIKVDNIINIDYSVLGYIDSNITVNVIQDGKIVRKIKMELPEKIEGVIECKNPRCITVTEHYVKSEFRLTNKDKKQYRCIYCDATYQSGVLGKIEEE